MNDDFEFDAVLIDREEEGLFARDASGQLIRIEAATAEDYERQITVKVDGTEITLPQATPLKDAQGTIVRDSNGATTPRYTTIYDAASAVFVKNPGDPHPIPTLCHKEHMQPAGVCRVCVVELYRADREGNRRSSGKLVPSCHHRIEQGMDIETIRKSEKVQESVRTLTELLVSETLTDSERSTGAVDNELEQLAASLAVEKPRFQTRTEDRKTDTSSFLINIDHNACILCDRCSRACTEIKHNNVIGRSGKGYQTSIGFDFNLPMGESSCVSCGECAVSCPTGALTFLPETIERQNDRLLENLDDDSTFDVDLKNVARPTSTDVARALESHRESIDSDDLFGTIIEELAEGYDAVVVPADLLVHHRLFRGIPYKFLQFNGGAVVYRKFKPDQQLCKQGDYGNTAFLIESGDFEIEFTANGTQLEKQKADGIKGMLGQFTTRWLPSAESKTAPSEGAGRIQPGEKLIRNKDNVILGEMTCLNRYPRSATVTAAGDAEVLEVRRNVLFMLQRNEASRRVLDRAYRAYALNSQLKELSFLKSLSKTDQAQCADILRDKVELIRLEPGQTIFSEGDQAGELYMVRVGYVKVTLGAGENLRVLNYLGPGSYFGEIGLLGAELRIPDEIVKSGFRPGTRSATCAALDHVELVRVSKADFESVTQQFPQARQALVEEAEATFERQVRRQRENSDLPSDYLEQGIYLANNLLVLDLERCTRCDECTKACSDSHDGVTRLIRDGLRFGNFLVASSCRSCQDPYCLIGCPVDAIHRDGDSLEIQIDNHCIGCGLCADSCPYGNINMHQRAPDKRQAGVKHQQATTCDLCTSVAGRGDKTSCVYACPHDAAHRMKGSDLLQIVQGDIPLK